MGHPGLHRAQPDGRAPLLQGEGRQWYHLRVGIEANKRGAKDEPPAGPENGSKT
jgi:hypothetical protein